MEISYFVQLLVVLAASVSADLDADFRETFKVMEDENGCTRVIRNFNPLLHKPKYTVGVYTNEGEEAAMLHYNMTFVQYLTATAGRKFDPPIEFDMTMGNLAGLVALAEEEKIDFAYATSSAASCMALELEAQPLVTIINRREARGHYYDLDTYGGVMFTLADNDRVNTIEDFRDKIIAAGGITAMGGGQTQFYEMEMAGMSFVAAPKQVVFTGNERKVVEGVLKGDFEIGFVRTDLIERYKDEDGEHIDVDAFKVINPQTHILDDGQLFPFVSSTGLHPEWPVMALDHVDRDVAREVQEALLALREHYVSIDLEQKMRCETTPEIAQLARDAADAGLLTGFRTARSYFEVRTKQEKARFILPNENNDDQHCIRGETLYEDVGCPPEHHKLTKEDFDRSCELVGKECGEDFTCFCKPCQKSYEVDIFQYHIEYINNSTTAGGMGMTTISTEGNICDKMSLCGSFQQTKMITMRMRDNVKRTDPNIVLEMHLDHVATELDVHKVPNEPFLYEFTWTREEVTVGILEIYFDGVQVPQSPVRIQVLDRQCEIDFPHEKRTNNAKGDCECGDGTMDIRGRCVESTLLAILISVAAVIAVTIAGYNYIIYKNRKGDEAWKVGIDELHFDDPVEVIGQGSFGVVLLAEYRGTKVALKRALKLTSGSKHGSKRGLRGAKKSGSHGSGTVGPTNSIGATTISSDGGGEDVELGSNENQSAHSGSQGSQGSVGSTSGGSTGRSQQNRSRGHSGSGDINSLGFLAADFGHKTSRWGFFGWKKNDSYHYRFNQQVLGSSGSGSSSLLTKTWHARLCPWLNASVKAQEDFITEMRILARLRHPCITTVMGAVLSSSHDPMLVMEYMEYGSLYDLLRNDTLHLSGEIILQVTRDVAQGLRFLHSAKPTILHGDLKARNILIDSRFRAKLCDFGLSTKKAHKITGTPFWMAPEYLRGQSEYCTRADIYSIGITLYEIYARANPFEGEDFRDTLRKICDRRTNKRPIVPDTCPPKMAELMKKCWAADPFMRPQAKDLDTALLDMDIRDAEPLTLEQQAQNARRSRTGDMLYDLFPKHIADALKSGRKVEPEQHDDVTVVFSQISHFAEITKNMPPFQVSDMLDRVFLAFDKVASKHNVFKVETVGDAYMGVTNLENDQDHNHTMNAALFAIDMVNEASKLLIDETKPELGHVNILAGFHSGPVVSNVIGSLNPRYGLFGDTVNTASRMQTNSKSNRVLCSEAAYKNLIEQAPHISAKKRGKIAIKGKGDMVVYWVGDGQISKNKTPLHGNASAAAEAESKKRVGFPEEDTDRSGEDHIERVDEKYWRQDLQAKLHDEDVKDESAKHVPSATSNTKPDVKKTFPKENHAPRKQGVITTTNLRSSGFNKNAVMRRSFDDE